MNGTRREFLWNIGGGFGGLAAAQMLARDALVGRNRASRRPEFNGGLHHPAKVRRVIQLFMTGGASPMDTFDYKPELEKLHGQKLGPQEKPEGFTAMPGAIMKSPFEFKQHGECGRWVSSVFPHQAQEVDEMAFLMAMASKTNVHGPATYMMNSGFLLPGFPCMGAWISYGLGNLTDELPTFVVLPDAKGLPYNQKGPFSAGLSAGRASRHDHQRQWEELRSPICSPIERYDFAPRDGRSRRLRVVAEVERRSRGGEAGRFATRRPDPIVRTRRPHAVVRAGSL